MINTPCQPPDYLAVQAPRRLHVDPKYLPLQPPLAGPETPHQPPALAASEDQLAWRVPQGEVHPADP